MTFLLQAAAIVGAARILGLVVGRLGQPMVVAEILTGIALGPSLLGWLAPTALAELFPESSMPLLGVVSQLGIVLFMFISGLELDPEVLRGRARSLVLISQASIALPFLLGLALALFLQQRPALGAMHSLAFLLFVATALSITAFPVLLRILTEQRLLHTRVGGIAVACAAIGDVTAWCILAFVVGIAGSTDASAAVMVLLTVAAYLIAMIGVVRPLLRGLRPFRLRSETTLMALALVLVFVSAAITERLGIHALFGGFIGGAIIPKEGRLAQRLAERFKPLVMVLLLPMFFAYSGLRTEVGLLRGTDAWIAFGLVLIVACAGKLGGSTLAARATGLSWRESSAIGVLMNTRGLVELIVLNVGLDLGILSPVLFTIMVLMAVATTLMTTPLLQWVYSGWPVAKEPVSEAAWSRKDVVVPPWREG